MNSLETMPSAPDVAAPAAESPETLRTYWKTSEVPRDREIWMRANVVTEDGPLTSCEPWEGRAQWDDKSQAWLSGGMSVAMFHESQVYPLEWIELLERVAMSGVEDVSIQAGVSHVHPQAEDLVLPWCARVSLLHGETSLVVFERFDFFETRWGAVEALVQWTRDAEKVNPSDALHCRIQNGKVVGV